MHVFGTRLGWALLVALLVASGSSTDSMEPSDGSEPAQATETPRPPRPIRGWDRFFAKIKLDDDRWRPNQLLVDTARELEPGRALDIGAGQGRNSLALVERGWDVTAIDSSSVGLDLAQRQALERGLTLDTRVVDAMDFELGVERWDLIVCSYVHELCLDRAQAIIAALAPGGTLVLEGFMRSDHFMLLGRADLGSDPNAPVLAFESLEILLYEELDAPADWYPGHMALVSRLVAQNADDEASGDQS